VKNVPKNLLPAGLNSEDEDEDEDGERLTTVDDVTSSESPPRKFANNIFEKLTDEPFDGVTPAPIPKSKKKKAPRKSKGSIESGENVSFEQSGATTTGILTSNEQINSGKSSEELDRQAKNLVVNENQPSSAPTAGNYQQPQPPFSNSDIFPNAQPQTSFQSQGLEQSIPIEEAQHLSQSQAGNLNSNSFTSQKQSVDFQPHKPLGNNPFINNNNEGIQSNYESGPIVTLNQQNPSNDPFKFNSSPGDYQVTIRKFEKNLK